MGVFERCDSPTGELRIRYLYTSCVLKNDWHHSANQYFASLTLFLVMEVVMVGSYTDLTEIRKVECVMLTCQLYRCSCLDRGNTTIEECSEHQGLS